jgi:uncharacterized repeat protein (TIGR03803 family)
VNRYLSFLTLTLAIAVSTRASGQTASQKTLRGHVPAVVRNLPPAGRVPPDQQMDLAIALPLQNSVGLSNLLQALYEPSHPSYRRYLKPQEFTARFGPTAEDYDAVRKFAEKHDLQITATHPNRMLLDLRGSAGNIEKAFKLRLNVYNHPREARTFFAPDSEPLVDATLPILSVSGLENYELPRPLGKRREIDSTKTFAETYTTGTAPLGYLSGNDFRNAYLPGVQLDGSGEAIGIFSMDGYFPNDVSSYLAQAGLPSVPLTNVLLNGFSGSPGNHNDEAALDITMAISMAPGLSKVIMYEGSVPNDILNAMANDNQARQLSCSWGFYPAIDPARDQIFQQFAAQGQTFFQASGDNGAWTQGVFPPSDNPYITIVGGTSLETAAPGGPLLSETAWAGSGGGFSTNFAIPPWQQGMNMVTNQGSTTMRNIPDVAAVADAVFWLVAFNGEFFVTAGTSASTPMWAGVCALANQRAAQFGQPPVGFINPAVYATGKSVAAPLAFHDILVGNNTNSTSSNRFFARPGYDLTTGWGTPAGPGLLSSLSIPPTLLKVNPTNGLFISGPAGGPFLPANQSFGITNFSTAPLTWSLVQTSSWLKASPLSGTLNPGAGVTLVNFTLAAIASNLPPGSYTSTLTFNNNTDYSLQTGTFTLAIVTAPTLSSQPSNQNVFEGSTAIFSSTAISNAFVGWRWCFDNGSTSIPLANDENISGAQTPTLTIRNVSTTNVGAYFVMATNGTGSVTSSNAFLTIVPWRPVIVEQPTNQTVLPGQVATLAVRATGSQPLFYQWQLNGSSVPGGQTATLGVSGSEASAGAYSVTISNSLGVATSTPAMLTIPPLLSPGSSLQVVHLFGSPQRSVPAPGGGTITIPASDAIDGSKPNELVLLPSGQFYGSTRHGGTNRTGTVFKLTTGNPFPTQLETLYHLNPTNDGATPFAALSPGPDGLLYGTAFQGGALGNGTIFKTTTNGALSTVVTLNGNIGDFPYSPLTLGQDGNFYGTTYKGAAALGTAFRLSTNGTLTTLHVFSGGADGSLPYAGLVQAPDGKLYGTTYKGGALGYGSVFSLSTNGAFSTLFSFAKTNGGNLFAGLVLATDGYLYGVAADGGAFGKGTLFRLSTSGQFTSLYSFAGGNEGRSPRATLVQAADGNIYGTTMFGGAQDMGTLFRFAPGSAPVTLAQFDGYNGANPDTALVQGPGDALYGTTQNGGNNNFGLIYSFNYSGLAPQITSQPQSQFVFAGTQVLLSPGVIGSSPLTYQWRKNGTNLIDGGNVFGANSRSLSISNATLANAGTYSLAVTNSLGFTMTADAVLQVTSSPPFIVSQPTNQTVAPGAFANFAVSAFGDAPLTYQWQKNGTNIADAGNLVGSATANLSLSSVIEPNGGTYRVIITNSLGAATSSPAILNVVPSSIAGTKFSTLYSFSGGLDGGSANALVCGTNGMLYGTTGAGGQNAGGTVFALSTNGSLSTLAQLGGSLGANPKSALALAPDGNLYGTAPAGGNTTAGTVFRLTHEGTLTNIYSFAGTSDGSHTVAGLASAPDGSLFGAAQDGGTLGYGTVFRIQTNGSFTNLYSFTNGSDGAHPATSLTRSTTGFLYGLTPGGANGSGNVFAISTSGVFSNLHTFIDNGDGAAPVGPLFQGLDGSLFGATRYFNLGGYELPGNAFRLGTNGAFGSMYVYNAFTKDGLAPAAGLIESSDGNLYGTTEFGGVSGNGVIYRLTPAGGYATVYEFDSFNSGANPHTALCEGPDGALYGSTSTGGPGGQGTIFKLSMTSAPQITMQPSGASVFSGANVSFAVAGFGAPSLGFRWRVNGTNLTDSGNLSGSFSRILTLTNISIVNTGNYTVVITNSLGSVASSVAALKVLFPPVIQNIVRTGNNVVLTYSTIPGQRYRPQWTGSLTNSVWTNLGLPTTASGSTLTYTDPVSINTQRFYRVQLFPN